MAKPTAARVVQKAPVARASRSENRASRAKDRKLRGQSHAQAGSALERRHRWAN